MAKKAILDVLESTIGKYVRNLDSESLNVAIWSGKIELNSLELNVDAVNAELDRQAAEAPNLAVPFRVTDGHFGNFEVDVPWSRLSSQSVVLRAKGLQVSVEPYDRLSKIDHLTGSITDEQRIKKAKEERQRSIQAYDDYRQQANSLRKLAEAEEQSDTKGSGAADSSFTGRLVRRIIENLQVEIDDVHISLKTEECSAGVVLGSLSLATTDRNGQRAFVDRTGTTGLEKNFLYKALRIEGLGIYLDEVQTALSQPFTIAEGFAVSSSATRTTPHTYILAPLSFEAKLRRSDDVKCMDHPKYLLSSQLSNLSVLLSRTQLELARKIQRAITPPDGYIVPLFPEYRPLARVSRETAREWWLYAIRCVGRINGRSSWVEFFHAFQKRKRYIPLYKRNAYAETCSWVQPLESHEVEELQELEDDRSISPDGLMAWRSIADAQIEKEREKADFNKKKSSKGSGVLSSFFGTSSAAKDDTAEDPPIVLSVDEMKELESISLQQSADTELTKDSKLCYVTFVLGSFKINLSTYGMKPILELSLGRVGASFDAMADGSYEFGFDLSSLEVRDSVTPRSLFPVVLRNVLKANAQFSEKAFELKTKKERTGDQVVIAKIMAVEMVASPMLVMETKKFFATTKEEIPASAASNNPMLAQSMTGSVDLFYDAAEGSSSRSSFATSRRMSGLEAFLLPEDSEDDDVGVTDKMASAMMEAWKQKSKEQIKWTIDCDVHAPIIIIPENCVSLAANALMFDLGHLRFKYGGIDVPPSVQRWLDKHPIPFSSHLDPGTITMDNLAVYARKTKEIAEGNQQLASHTKGAILEPLSVSLDVGVESKVGEVSPPRLCAFGTLPSISLMVSPQQVAAGLSVVKQWKSVLASLTNSGERGGTEIVEEGQAILDASASSLDSSMLIKMSTTTARALESKVYENDIDTSRPSSVVFVTLKRLSLLYREADGVGVDAHLVSVDLSSSQYVNGSSAYRLRMGWFWIHDKLQYDFPRRQRLVAHSKLPLSATEFAAGEYRIINELANQGVFRETFGGSSDLADISVVIGKRETSQDKLLSMLPGGKDVDPKILTDVTMSFSTLFVNWNPRSIAILSSTLSSIVSSVSDGGSAPFTDAVTSPAGRPPVERKPEAPTESLIQIKATLEKLELCLRSARDDDPIFVATMSRANVDLLLQSGERENTIGVFNLGDVRLESSSIGSVRPEYKTALGLAPGQYASLLQVRYFQGKESLLSTESDVVRNPSVNSFAEIQLSPMRLVYLQAQVLTLVEYATEGILGTLTARAASNVASAAVEMVSKAETSSVFSVKATGFDVVLPVAAESHRHFLLRASALQVVYHGEPNPKSSGAEINLEGVTLSDHGSAEMTRAPIGMKISVTLPPAEIGSLEDQKLRCHLAVEDAQFVVAKEQYQMIFDMLDGNIGEADPKLRETVAAVEQDGEDEMIVQQLPTIADGDLTHGGVVFVERKQRLSVDISMSLLSLELCGRSIEDSIVKLSAEDGSIVYNSLPDSDTMMTDIALHALTCDDSRPKAEGRQFRKLFSHDDGTEVFRLHYSSNSNTRRSNLVLRLGSPQAVFVPDVISDVLDFVTVSSSSKPPIPTEIEKGPDDSAIAYGSEVDIENDENGIEVKPHLDRHLSHSTLSINTEMCRFILVDLGSSVADANAQSLFKADHRATEAIVLRCGLSTTIATDTDQRTSETEKSDIEFHGKDFEVYTASGEELKTPLQVLEPTSVTVVYGTLPCDGGTLLDLKAVTLNPIDVAFSMQNLALISAISSSLSDSLDSRELAQSDVGIDHILTDDEAQRIERLATELETKSEQNEPSVQGTPSIRTNTDNLSVGSTYVVEKSKLSKKWNMRLTFPAFNFTMINDLQGVDDALLRLRATNIALGLEAEETLLAGRSQFIYDFHTNSSVLADYFDISRHRWKRLLTKPWELNVKSSRGLNRRFRSSRLSTTVDVESFPCHLSISEQFLISLGSANRMWQVYSAAIASASKTTEGRTSSQESLKRALAANAARNLIVSLPYGVENNCGHDVHFVRDLDFDSSEQLHCAVGKVRFFRFNVVSGDGVGGKRLYGQDIEKPKSLSVIIDGTQIVVSDMDGELGHPCRTHTLKSGGIIITEIVKVGNTTTLRIASHVEMTNTTSIPFRVAVVKSGVSSDFGVCGGTGNVLDGAIMEQMDENNTKASKRFGIPTRFLGNPVDDKTCLVSISPCLAGDLANVDFKGEMTIPTTRSLRLKAGKKSSHAFDVTCRADDVSRTKSNPESLIPFVVHVKFEMTLVGKSQPLLNIVLKPRVSIENKTPIVLAVKTPMPFTFTVHKAVGKARKPAVRTETDVIHTLDSNDSIQVFSPSASIAIAAKCSDQPVGGGVTGWIEGDWVDLPMIPEFRLQEPLRCVFPFQNTRSSMAMASGQRTPGIEFFIVDKVVDFSMLSSETVRKEIAKTEESQESQGEELQASSPSDEEAMRQYFITVSNYGVDHTGEILFEQLMVRKQSLRQSSATSGSLRKSSLATPSSTPFSAFATARHLGRVSLLPMADVPLRLLHLTMEGDVGLRRSLPFSVDDVSICNGGVESTAILWEDGLESGFYAYRTLVDSYQSEVHVVPEFVVYNGSKEHQVLVRQQTGNGPVSEILLEPTKVAPIRRSTVGLILSFHFVEVGGYTPWMRFEGLSHKISVVRTMDNTPIGSLACQTVIGSKDSRFVVKLAAIKWANTTVSSGQSLLKDDFLRFRVRWSELRICVKESYRGDSSKSVPLIESAIDHILEQKINEEADTKRKTKRENYATWKETRLMRGDGLAEVDEGNDDNPVFTIVFQRFTLDWQKVFKEQQVKSTPERSQVSVIIHHLQILDNSPKAHFPVVFSSKSSMSFIDLCIRFRGPMDVDLIRVDLIDLNLCHSKGKSEKIVVSTSEEFVWKVLDVADRILMATKELAGVDMQLQWNEMAKTFDVVVTETAEHLTERVNYVPPESDTLYHVNKLQVSPFMILASFKRQPQKSRYKLLKGVQGAKIVNYFTTRLKFTLDRAELKFSRYTTYEPIKGPADRLLDQMAAVYVNKTKMKMVTILSAVSFQDWKYLASRDDGDDAYKEGDLFRVAGNGVGGGANFVLKKMGSGLGRGVATVGHKLGDGIENAAGAVGARTVGAGVNCVVSGIGDGVGDTVKGVGTGAGKVVKGAGKGVGQIFGGVTGGVLMVGKGIGKGVTTGDATAIASGFKDGAVSIGTGVGAGLETAVVGVGDGVFTVGKGVFSGVKNVGKGIGGAFRGSSKKQDQRRSSSQR